jgi:extracellular elastinolytic metalloproteinase
MVAFNKFFSSVFLAVVYASAATAAPWEATSKHATHRTRSVGKRGLTFSTFNPASTYEVICFDISSLFHLLMVL